MKYRLLGKSGLRVSEAALGTMTFGDEWGWGSPKAEAQKVYETYRERKNVESVKQITPKHTRCDGSLQIAVSSSNHPNISSDSSSAADTLKLVLL
jgi:hypothetical protein